MSAALRVIAPGPSTTLQDGGRSGWLRYGLPPSGALDPLSLAIANLRAGNQPEAAALELTLAGGTFAAEGSLRIALAGAKMPLAIDGVAVASERSHTLKPGAVLRIGAAEASARAYLAVGGGFAAAMQFGSCATHLRAGIGGFAGRALAAGDLLPVAGEAAGHELALDATPPARATIRIIPGPQDDHFAADAVATLCGGDYRVTAQWDRMGCRLEGPALRHKSGFNIVSDAIASGSIQVPGGGQPIVLLADRQTTGGYPKIATVISADLPAFAQKRPGDPVRFECVTLEEAVAARLAMRRWREALPGKVRPVGLDSERLLDANLISGVTDGG
jgi:5-oxoprolinase (ATP-hydrolysing) subunit C